MRFVFVRHGHYARSGGVVSRERLTERGREAVRNTAWFLKSRSLMPERVFSTPTGRTEETARIIIGEMGLSLEPQVSMAAFNSIEGLLRKLELMTDGMSRDGVLLLVCHQPNLDLLRGAFGGPLGFPRSNLASALVYGRSPEEKLSLLSHHPGEP